MKAQTSKDTAISYARFSHPKQSAGDSEERQVQLFTDFCRRHHLQPAKDHYFDRGASGYSGKHVGKKGQLGWLLELAQRGTFRPGTVLVVEAWDRLGRLIPNKQIRLIEELLETGLKIGVCRLDHIFEMADFGTDKWTTLSVFVQLAYQESKQKSDRLESSWKARRKQARETHKIISGRVPAWLEMSGGVLRPIPDRVAVVKRIFALAAAGYGQSKIVGVLTREKVPAFGKPKGNKRSQFSGRWTKGYIDLILNDRKAIGQFQPCGKNRKPDGPPIKDYYPAVVTEDEFVSARQGAGLRTTKQGPRQSKHLNLFVGLLRNAADGESFTLHNKGTKAKPRLVLLSASGGNGRGAYVTLPYGLFERAILSQLREVKASDLAPSAKGPNAVDVLTARLKNVNEEIGELKNALRKRASAAVAEVLTEKEAEHDRTKDELDKARAEQINPIADEWAKLPNLADALDQAEDQEDARIRLRAVLSRAVEKIHVLLASNQVDIVVAVAVEFKGHKWDDDYVEHPNREYLIRYRRSYSFKPGFWQVRTQRPEVELPGLSFLPIYPDIEPVGVECEQELLQKVLDDPDGWFRGCEQHPIP
jgi:DNA invertase Pin-like site-specific DNA recombinase